MLRVWQCFRGHSIESIVLHSFPMRSLFAGEVQLPDDQATMSCLGQASYELSFPGARMFMMFMMFLDSLTEAFS